MSREIILHSAFTDGTLPILPWFRGMMAEVTEKGWRLVESTMEDDLPLFDQKTNWELVNVSQRLGERCIGGDVLFLSDNELSHFQPVKVEVFDLKNKHEIICGKRVVLEIQVSDPEGDELKVSLDYMRDNNTQNIGLLWLKDVEVVRNLKSQVIDYQRFEPDFRKRRQMNVIIAKNGRIVTTGEQVGGTMAVMNYGSQVENY